MQRVLSIMWTVVAALALSACAASPYSASSASLSSAGELLARTWGAAPGSSREALSKEIVRSLAEDPAFAAASSRKPAFVSDEKFWAQFENEGFAMLPDAELRQAAALKLRLLQDATPGECQSYVATLSSGAWLSPESEQWRARLARASDEDFWSSMQLSKRALLERARRIDEPALTLTEKEYITAFGILMLSMPEAVRTEMLSLGERSGEPKAADACRFAVHLLKAQTTASGASLRIGYVAAPN